ncbi:hypothetical protein [Actinoplanes sp. NPDC048796]|uniref:hypothetical protein n=1 Tax=Actinoplanes sp. NPDC048796 TaxID=3155640 RepID=UPI0033C9114A
MKFTPDWVEAIGTWVGGVGTGLAVIYAARGVRISERNREEDARQARKAERESQAAQARTLRLHSLGVDGHVGGRLDTFKGSIGNYGLHPVTNIVGKLVYIPTKQEIGIHIGGPTPITVLDSGDSQELSWDLQGYGLKDEGELVMGRSQNLFDFEVHFTDVHGNRWAIRPGAGEQPFRLFDPVESGVKPRGLGNRVRAAAKALRGS